MASLADIRRARELSVNLPRAPVPKLSAVPQLSSRTTRRGRPTPFAPSFVSRPTVVNPIDRLRRSILLDPNFQPESDWVYRVKLPAGLEVDKNADLIEEFYRIRRIIFGMYPPLRKEFEFNALKSSVFLDDTYVPTNDWMEHVPLPDSMSVYSDVDPIDEFYRIRHDIFKMYPQLEEIYRDKLTRLSLTYARAETRASSSSRELIEDELRRSDASDLSNSEELFPQYIDSLGGSLASLENSPTHFGSLRDSHELFYFQTHPRQNPANYVQNPSDKNDILYIGPSDEQWLSSREEYLTRKPEMRFRDVTPMPSQVVDPTPWDPEDLKSSLNEIDDVERDRRNYFKERLRAMSLVNAQSEDIAREQQSLQTLQIAKYLQNASINITRPLNHENALEILEVALEISSIDDLELVYHYTPGTFFFNVMKAAILYVHGQVGDADSHFTEEGRLFDPTDFIDYVRRNDSTLYVNTSAL